MKLSSLVVPSAGDWFLTSTVGPSGSAGAGAAGSLTSVGKTTGSGLAGSGAGWTASVGKAATSVGLAFTSTGIPASAVGRTTGSAGVSSKALSTTGPPE